MTFTIEACDTELEWLERRGVDADGECVVTSTDQGVLFNVSTYKVTRQLWLDKREPSKVSAPTPLQTWGHRFEFPVADDFKAATGLELIDPGRWTLFRAKRKPLACSIDRLVMKNRDDPNPIPVECKSAWGDAARVWDTIVPPSHQLQAQAQMAVLGADQAYFAAWLFDCFPPTIAPPICDKCLRDVAALMNNGRAPTFRLHTIARDNDVIEKIWERSEQFAGMVNDGVAPAVDGSYLSSRALGQQYRNPIDETIELPMELLDTVEEIARFEAEAKTAEAEAVLRKNQLRDVLGERTTGVLPDGRKITWKENAAGSRVLRIGKNR